MEDLRKSPIHLTMIAVDEAWERAETSQDYCNLEYFSRLFWDLVDFMDNDKKPSYIILNHLSACYVK